MLIIEAKRLAVGDVFSTDNGLVWHKLVRFNGVAQENLSPSQEFEIMLLTTERDHITMLDEMSNWTEDTVTKYLWLRRNQKIVVR